jgi:hypothetical protein
MPASTIAAANACSAFAPMTMLQPWWPRGDDLDIAERAIEDRLRQPLRSIGRDLSEGLAPRSAVHKVTVRRTGAVLA